MISSLMKPRLTLIIAVLPLMLLWSNPTLAETSDTAQAQSHFRNATDLYAEGRYEEALAAYQLAHELVPHNSSLFNMARCHENLGDLTNALARYREALEATEDERERADLQRRIGNILQRPVRVFVTSEPSGAEVLVDANESPLPGRTPTTIDLVPGPHRLILTLEGHMPSILRVEVEVGQTEPINAQITPVAQGSECPQQEAPACPSCQRVSLEGRHPHISAGFPQMLSFGDSESSFGASASGLGLEGYLNIDHWMVGGAINIFSIFGDPEEKSGVLDPDEDGDGEVYSYTSVENLLAINIILEAGYIWSWDIVSLGVIGGISVSIDLRSRAYSDQDGPVPEEYAETTGDGRGTFAYENGQLHGVVGVMLDFYIRRWFSISIKSRLLMGSTIPDPDFRFHTITSTMVSFHI